ncbi:zinc finger protein 185 isoform X1 [Epinephelus lanceolatus]|uniref:zinc finger protein 185 isoform X1 n=1 Tax=Epinephelus lanceolatus TaxID=310571 RepID=UPI0014486D7F|nr:zinc finger protein 185 isoform X1 [Epinephelus lanceolatus]
MSKEGDKESVFRTTKVRTRLRDDGSWLQRRSSDENAKTSEEKPWLAEVRAGRENGAPIETSPVSSPTKSTPPPTKPVPERAPSSGYLIRGVFTKMDKPASPTATNGISGTTTTQFTKKPSESYKKIAPYTVRPTSENQDGQLSNEEQERRTEAASSVLKKSAVRQRSYVLSAAKKYESKEPDTSLVNNSISFVAKRVEISDDDESAPTPAPASTLPPSPVVPVTSVASAPEPRPRKIADTSVKTAVDVAVNEPVAPKVEEVAPEPVKEDPPPASVTVKDPFEDMIPGCTKVAIPLPELKPELVQAVYTEPEPEDSNVPGQADMPLVDLTPVSPTPLSPTPATPPPVPAVPESPAPLFPVSLAPVSPVQMSAVAEITVKTEPEPEPEPEPASNPFPKPRSGVDTLTTLSDTLISFDASSTSFKDDEPVLAKEEGGSTDINATEDSDEEEPAPEISSCTGEIDDLLDLTNGPEESAEPVPASPGRWSQFLLSGLDGESDPEKTSGTLNLLADDIIPVNTEARSLSTQREEEKQTDETAEGTQSPTETVTITTKTVIITDKRQEDSAAPWSSRVTTTVTESSSADPFDPYPLGTTSSNSSSDLLQPLSDTSINSAPPTFLESKDPSPETNSSSSNALESLADNVNPISSDTTSLISQRSWARTWETSTPQQANTEESQEAAPGGQTVDQETLVMFERKSTENDSPWDRWTSPTVYTITTTRGEEEEEEEEEESPRDTQTETVTTITTIREIHSEPQPAMDRYETYSRSVTVEDQRVHTPEPEAKKGFVYLKEYVSASELALHNARDNIDSGSDYLTSSSTSYSYSIPSPYSSRSLSSTCTYCGELVGNDAKISIEHLNINCHPTCFKCEMCRKPMGDLLDSMFLHGGKVHCETCYSRALD